MNLLDAYVTKVLGEPTFNDTYKDEGIVWWQVDVEYDAYGPGQTCLTFKTKEEAAAVQAGYKFLT